MVGYAGLNRAKMKYLKPEVKVLDWSLNRLNRRIGTTINNN